MSRRILRLAVTWLLLGFSLSIEEERDFRDLRPDSISEALASSFTPMKRRDVAEIKIPSKKQEATLNPRENRGRELMREQFGTPVDDFDTDSHGLQTAIDGQALPTETIEQNTQQNVEDAHVQRVAKVCLAIFFRKIYFHIFYLFLVSLPVTLLLGRSTNLMRLWRRCYTLRIDTHSRTTALSFLSMCTSMRINPSTMYTPALWRSLW
jgi:hypothetical protein